MIDMSCKMIAEFSSAIIVSIVRSALEVLVTMTCTMAVMLNKGDCKSSFISCMTGACDSFW